MNLAPASLSMPWWARPLSLAAIESEYILRSEARIRLGESSIPRDRSRRVESLSGDKSELPKALSTLNTRVLNNAEHLEGAC